MSTRFSLSMEMSRLTRDGTTESVSRDKTLKRERGQGNIHFLCSAAHEQDWQPYRLIHTLGICVIIHTCISSFSITINSSILVQTYRVYFLEDEGALSVAFFSRRQNQTFLLVDNLTLGYPSLPV